ncbi:MAG: radical SAM protein, partial [Bryobacteraceae bacterium]|nr:radical SAM protein [Bryobacteraceae bacterium]
RQHPSDNVIDEIVALRRRGFRFIALADDNFYPVTLTDLALAERQNNTSRLAFLRAVRAERFELMARLAELPKDITFFTQITMEAAEDTTFLDAMRKARIRGALVGVEAVTPEGLKNVYKDFNCSGEELVRRLKTFRAHGVHILGSFIFGLPSDRPETFDATLEMAKQAEITFAQFVMLTPFPGTVDFEKWEKAQGPNPESVDGIPLTRYWLIPAHKRPKMFMPHPVMSSPELRERTQSVWDRFYSLQSVFRRSKCATDIRARLAFIFVSRLYRQMYANTGIATDSARRNRASFWASMLAKPTLKLFQGPLMPGLVTPVRTVAAEPETLQVEGAFTVLK